MRRLIERYGSGAENSNGFDVHIGDLIIEVRSATAGFGTFTAKIDPMAELTRRTADQIIAAKKASQQAA